MLQPRSKRQKSNEVDDERIFQIQLRQLDDIRLQLLGLWLVPHDEEVDYEVDCEYDFTDDQLRTQPVVFIPEFDDEVGVPEGCCEAQDYY